MEKENLDNLFRESLDELSQTPDPKVWGRIQASLDKKAKRRRRITPLWWQVGGAAAALALLFYVLIPPSEETSIPLDNPVSENPVLETSEDPTGTENMDPTSPSQEAIGIEQDNNTSLPNSSNINTGLPSGNAVTGVDTARDMSLDTYSEGFEKATRDSDVAQNNLQNKTEEPPVAADTDGVISPNLEEAVVVSSTTPSGIEKTDEALPETGADPEMVTDQEKAFQELFTETEEDVSAQDDNRSKWAVGPSVAPVYFNGAGGGSPIDPAFSSNDKSGNLNMSYGLQVTYQLNKRWQLRSGLHKVDYGYNTNDIVFSSSLQASSASNIENIDYASTASYLVVESQTTTPVKADSGFRTEVAARNTAREGTMVQEFGYMEIPLEMNYALIDRTIGLNLISGLSSMFLVDNSISLESESGSTEVGEANNLNAINFSANFGVGFKYKLNEKVNVQVEPMLKYHLNTFSNTAGEFRPYSIGVYSGIRYKF